MGDLLTFSSARWRKHKDRMGPTLNISRTAPVFWVVICLVRYPLFQWPKLIVFQGSVSKLCWAKVNNGSRIVILIWVRSLISFYFWKRFSKIWHWASDFFMSFRAKFFLVCGIFEANCRQSPTYPSIGRHRFPRLSYLLK